jgi:cytochrome bd-type quinol oxidase subunit 1
MMLTALLLARMKFAFRVSFHIILPSLHDLARGMASWRSRDST